MKNILKQLRSQTELLSKTSHPEDAINIQARILNLFSKLEYGSSDSTHAGANTMLNKFEELFPNINIEFNLVMLVHNIKFRIFTSSLNGMYIVLIEDMLTGVMDAVRVLPASSVISYIQDLCDNINKQASDHEFEMPREEYYGTED